MKKPTHAFKEIADVIDQDMAARAYAFKQMAAHSEYRSLLGTIARVCITALDKKHKIMACGNGGSFADAQHMIAEFVGAYKNRNRPPMAALMLPTNSSDFSAIANDYGYEEVFARPLRGLGKKDDILFGISTSGGSKNIIKAFEAANEMGIYTIALTGQNPSEMSRIANIWLPAPATVTNIIQEVHIQYIHSICGAVENHFFGKGR